MMATEVAVTGGRINTGRNGATNTTPTLTRNSDTSREGLAVNATQVLPTRRSVNPDPHPELIEAVAVSRFWRMVQSGADDECWPWAGDTRKGYGVFFYKGSLYGAHELALTFSTGERRHPTLDTCHSCDNPICCNPAHLRFDTRASNVREMVSRGRSRNGSKLDAADVRLMRERRALGARQKDLADQFGITDGQVSMIIRGLRWAHAGGPIENERRYCRG